MSVPMVSNRRVTLCCLGRGNAVHGDQLPARKHPAQQRAVLINTFDDVFHREHLPFGASQDFRPQTETETFSMIIKKAGLRFSCRPAFLYSFTCSLRPSGPDGRDTCRRPCRHGEADDKRRSCRTSRLRESPASTRWNDACHVLPWILFS